MKLLRPFLCILCFAACLYAIAQKPPLTFKRITSKDGLSGDVVYCLHQDRQGFLWIGTHRGLNRYDGYNFNHYNYDPSDTNSLSGNHVPCIKEDAYKGRNTTMYNKLPPGEIRFPGTGIL